MLLCCAGPDNIPKLPVTSVLGVLAVGGLILEVVSPLSPPCQSDSCPERCKWLPGMQQLATCWTNGISASSRRTRIGCAHPSVHLADRAPTHEEVCPSLCSPMLF